MRLTRLVLPGILACATVIGCGPQASPAPRPVPGAQPSPGPQRSSWPAAQGPQAAPASQNNSTLVGTWRLVTQNDTLTLTIAADGQYSQVSQPPPGGTVNGQGGPYQLVAPNTIILSVTDWSPKTKWMFVPKPTCGIPAVPNPTNPRRDSCSQQQEMTMPQPPGSRYAYTFNGPNTMIFKNENAQETITFTRVTAQ